MGYVPGQKWDLFLSYAHTDAAWADAFRASLCQGLQEKLGVPVALWQDTRELQLGQKWPAEIAEAIREAAAFMAICSPSYFQSQWCKKEREALLGEGDIEKLKIGAFYRFLKILKTPSAPGIDDSFLSELQHIQFFDQAEEFLPTSGEFQSNVRRAVGAIAELLRTMRNGRQALYIAPTSNDVEEDWVGVRTQLKDYGYNVRPEAMLGPEFGDRLLKQEIELCGTSVFLLGAEYHAYVEHQIKTARELGSKLIFWIHPAADKGAGDKQKKLLTTIRNAEDLPKGSQVLGGNSIRDLIHDLLEILKPKPQAEPLALADGDLAKVYLLYDTTAQADTQFADGLRDMMRGRQMAVFVPDSNLAKSTDRIPRHEQMMRECNGVLLYRGASPKPDNWLYQTVPDVLWAERKYGRPPFAAKTLLLADPAELQGIGDVDLIPCLDNFAPQTLQPFFDRLQKAR